MVRDPEVREEGIKLDVAKGWPVAMLTKAHAAVEQIKQK